MDKPLNNNKTMQRPLQVMACLLLLVLHTCLNLAMATQMQLAALATTPPLLSTTLPDTSNHHCPHRAQHSVTHSSPDAEQTTSDNRADCCDSSEYCVCISMLTSLRFTEFASVPPFLRSSQRHVELPSLFPESPPGLILRPPIA